MYTITIVESKSFFYQLNDKHRLFLQFHSLPTKLQHS